MKFIKKALKILVLVIIILVVGVWFYSKTYHPTYNGELELKNLSDEVTVYFDEIGVPHINAKNQKDAYVTLGYVHAQDRLWQMELIRRIAAGRLSEILGKELLKTDVFFAGLGIEEASEKTVANLDKNSKTYLLTQAYLAGVNQFINEGKTPLEFSLLGIKKENYTIKDIHNVIGYMAFSFAVAHKTDPLLTEVKEKLGNAYFKELMTSSSENLTINKTEVTEIKGGISNAVSTIMDNLPVSTFIGSNSWVIGAEKTKNGKVIFANDPHIAFSQPSVWYQSHITTPDFEMYGFNIALIPFPLLGHNSEYSYGLTMLANDDINFYVEENNPKNTNQYKTSEGYKDYEIFDKTIHIKDEQDTTFQVKVSTHGPIMNGLISHLEEDRPIAMNWIYTQLNSEVLDAVYEMSHSKSLATFEKAVSKIHAPGLNVMYGDAKNNIAWFASAKLYELRDSVSSKTYLDGVSGKDEIIAYIPFSENPKAINPKSNYVYSANNQIDSVRGKLYPGYYEPEDRAKRIVELLDQKDDFTKEDVAKMMFDVKSSTVSEIANNLIKNINSVGLSVSEKKAILILEKWDGSYFKNSVAATIYNRFLYEFLSATYKDELGDGFDLFINSQLQDQALPIQINRAQSVWWDDISTPSKLENREEIISNSFKNAFSFLENQLGKNVDDWLWSRVISVEHEHAIGKAGGLLRKIFNVGPFETIGGHEVINNQIFKLDSTGLYNVTAGASTRIIVDFSDVENSLAIIPTGQSGNVFSEHYKDQAEKYRNGEYVKMKLNEIQIRRSENVLILKPEK
ncbi:MULTISPECIES: penicillin acylase family protein [unclassified Polaribacter]|uniref:penicillin acylase family protein n=1 Tax=unclassified Polaribacter TaxID=196858 RepID=UPI0011BE821A|nr:MULTISPECIES: penicillin acylase family protein [unclassified Polaribacter]TXD53172.1 penicillin acylase family protein [Polaribacter sp. IC063]TXD61320.1 penicillin acylase family protein [Polaribacter sp. IC066]